jgi:hypothetical protein
MFLKAWLLLHLPLQSQKDELGANLSKQDILKAIQQNSG